MNQAFEWLRAGREEEKETAAEQLMAAGQQAVPGLVEILQVGDEDSRWWAARALAGIPGPAATQALIKTLADPNQDVQVCAILGLGERQEEKAVDKLLALFPLSNNYARQHVSDALSKIGEPAVLGLIKTLEHEHPTVRAQAARALVRIESQQAIPALIKALDDPEPTVEHYAWEALQRMGVGATIFFKP